MRANLDGRRLVIGKQNSHVPFHPTSPSSGEPVWNAPAGVTGNKGEPLILVGVEDSFQRGGFFHALSVKTMPTFRTTC
jgi:hypothetical protein